jgi:hypothetical protein
LCLPSFNLTNSMKRSSALSYIVTKTNGKNTLFLREIKAKAELIPKHSHRVKQKTPAKWLGLF